MARDYSHSMFLQIIILAIIPSFITRLFNPANCQLLKIGAFYITEFSIDKTSNWRFQVIKSIIERYDVVYLQGIRGEALATTLGGEVLPSLVGQYSIECSPRFGSAGRSLQNAFIYRSDRVRLRATHVHDTGHHWPAFIAFFQVKDDGGTRSFTLIGKTAIKSHSGTAIRNVLNMAANVIHLLGATQAVAILGTLNMMRGNADKLRKYSVVIDPRVSWENFNHNTMVSEDGTWNDVIITIGQMAEAVEPNTAVVHAFDQGWNDKDKAQSVSRHYPVEIQIRTAHLPRYQPMMPLPFDQVYPEIPDQIPGESKPMMSSFTDDNIVLHEMSLETTRPGLAFRQRLPQQGKTEHRRTLSTEIHGHQPTQIHRLETIESSNLALNPLQVSHNMEHDPTYMMSDYGPYLPLPGPSIRPDPQLDLTQPHFHQYHSVGTSTAPRHHYQTLQLAGETRPDPAPFVPQSEPFLTVPVKNELSAQRSVWHQSVAGYSNNHAIQNTHENNPTRLLFTNRTFGLNLPRKPSRQRP